MQANFGRTGSMFAFETYGIEPDIVVLGKGLGNGVPVAAAVGRADCSAALDYGEGSDTWSANPLCCAAVLATLDEFDAPRRPRARCRPASRGHRARAGGAEGVPVRRDTSAARSGGMVWGVEMQRSRRAHGRAMGERARPGLLPWRRPDGDGIHLLGPLSKKVVRVAPPLVITQEEATAAIAILTPPRRAPPIARRPVR